MKDLVKAVYLFNLRKDNSSDILVHRTIRENFPKLRKFMVAYHFPKVNVKS